MSWSKSLQGFADEQEKRLNAELRALSLQALTGVIERSPVDTGRFRGNNQVTIGRQSHSELDREDKTGRATQAEGAAAIQDVSAPFTYITIQNNLPYAGVLEAGSSSQAPAGIYAITFNNIKEAAGR